MYSYQQGGAPSEEQIIQAVAQALQQGIDPSEILKQLVKMGMDQDQATQVIQAVAQQMQGGAPSQQMEEAPEEEQMMMKAGGTFSGNLFYQTGGAYIPSYGEYAYGGHRSEIPRLFNQPVDRPQKAMYGAFSMAKGGSYNNPGFKALPDFVQQKIMEASGKAMYGMGMMAKGGQMPQWLAERRFAAAGNTDKLDSYGYEYGGQAFVKGGMMEMGGQYNIGDEIDVTPEELEMLKKNGYKFKIIK